LAWIHETSGLDVSPARKKDMGKSKKILVAVDGSPQSLHAVRYFALNFSKGDLKVNLMQVLSTEPEPFRDMEKGQLFSRKMRTRQSEWIRKEKESAQEFLEETRQVLLKANLRESNLGLILQERQVGIARDIIAESSRGYDAVVIGRQGSSKFRDIFLGSVSYKIVQAVGDIPVWVVGGDIRSKKMLIAVDGSKNSRKAVDYVGTFAAVNGAEVTLFNAVREFRLAMLDISTPGGEEIEEKILAELEKDVQRMFNTYRRRLEKAGVEARGISSKYILQSRSRSGDIIKEAKEGEFGTIVMGRRGLSSVHEFPLGRVTTKVLNRADQFALWIVP
jgi:nucleotide-binding universal stress UspA family protein